MNYSLYKSYQQMLNSKSYQLLWELFMVENAHLNDVGVF